MHYAFCAYVMQRYDLVIHTMSVALFRHMTTQQLMKLGGMYVTVLYLHVNIINILPNI